MTSLLPNLVFIGRAGAGKTTAANLCCDYLNYWRLSFATPLKDMAAGLWGEEARTDREKLQRLGVSVREIQNDTWVNMLLKELDKDKAGPFVIDDCRFPNEFEALRGRGFIPVRIEASRGARLNRLRANGKLQDEAQLDHVSETAADELTALYRITNADTVGHLWTQIVRIINANRK